MLPWAKLVTWGIFLGLVYSLRSLFTVFFITFVISYICRNIVRFLYAPFGARTYIRKIIVILTFLFLLGGFYLGGRFLIPNIYEQGSQVWGLAKDLQIQEGLDSAFAKLYASIRFNLYEDSNEYKKDFEDYRDSEEADPEMVFQLFHRNAERIQLGFRDSMVKEFGEAAWETFRESPDFAASFNQWQEEWILEKEYKPNREKLEAEAEQALKDRWGETGCKNLQSKHGEWTEYLKKDILDRIYAEIDGVERMEYRNRFRENYVQITGKEAVEKMEGSPEWEDGFKNYYEGLPDEEWPYPYALFDPLLRAQDKTEYARLLGNKEAHETTQERVFRNQKKDEFVEIFKNYEIVKEMNKRTTEDFLPSVAKWVAAAIEFTVTHIFHLILSIFLSFFIVWDVPKLKEMINRLEDSRIGKFYREVRPGLASFGWLMGRAFQAQAIIAAVNTALTLSAMSMLGVPHRTFLCSIVFICSFIPVVGVVISSIPIAVVCLQLPGGLVLALEMVGCILIIHFIETTLLNPKIMGDMLKGHPLLGLVMLVVGEHFFGVWGLLLGVPVSVYIFRFVILRETSGLLPAENRATVRSRPNRSPVEPTGKAAGKT